MNEYKKQKAHTKMIKRFIPLLSQNKEIQGTKAYMKMIKRFIRVILTKRRAHLLRYTT